jgi:hypothetical protein
LFLMLSSGTCSSEQGTLSELGIYSSFLGNGTTTFHSKYVGK